MIVYEATKNLFLDAVVNDTITAKIYAGNRVKKCQVIIFAPILIPFVYN